MAALGNVSVTSAAIIEGSLIIGLSDGSIINCGYVQGPQGLKGDRGPMGATGERGTDGATIHTVKGPPPADLGKDGDYAINNRDWFIFGPKASGMWGAGQGMLPKDIHQPVFGGSSNQGGGPIGGSNNGGGSGSDGPVFTSQVIATGTGRLKPSGRGSKVAVNYPGSANGIISPSGEMNFQSNINGWIVDALDELEGAIPVPVVDSLPGAGDYDGQLVLHEGSLQIWVGSEWVKVSADGGAYIGVAPPMPAEEGQLWFNNNENELTLYIYDGKDWVPAAPPVSLQGIESNVTLLQEVTSQLQTDIATTVIKASEEELKVLDLQESQAAQDTKIEALEASQTVQDNQIIELEEEIESLAPSLDRGKWNLAELGEGVTLAAGQYAMGIGANRVYCEEQYAQCLAAIDGNPSENPEASGECNRIASACFNAVDNGTEYFMNDWSHATLLHFHKTDSEGKNHTFADYKVGMFIDLFDQGDTGFAVFEITAAATLDGDVYTIGVHPVQHEGEAAGLARVKVFELAGADPTEFVRNTGDTMTGTLYIRPPKDSAGLRIYAPQGDAGAGQADATQLVRVANSHNQYVFYVEESGAIAGKDGMLPTLNRHLTSKKYVDELIAAELTAPARFEWKVYVNADGTPLQGSANLNGASMSDTSVIRLHKHALNAPVPIKGHGSGLTMYKHSPSPKLYYSTILSAWSKSGAEWQWKGTAEIDEIKLFSDYIQIKLGYRKESNMNFSNTGYYRFTVGGLF